MRAVRWHARRDVRVEDIPVPRRPGAGEIRVRVACCGICGTDVHEYLHGPVTVPLEPHPVTGASAPIVLGHEVSGWVQDVGAGVPHLSAGDLVALNALIPCGVCPSCRTGREQLCLQLGHIGMSADGGLAAYLTVPAAMAVRVPAGLDPAVAALAEPFAVALHALSLPGEQAASPAVVLGAGTIGLCVALLLAERGERVTLVDVAAERLRHASSLGLHAVAAAHAGALRGTATVVFECSGAATAVADAPSYAEPGGAVVLLGLPTGPVPLDVVAVVLRETRLLGSMSHLAHPDMAGALAYLSRNGERARRLVTARIPLEQTVDAGFGVLTGPGRDRHAKILVDLNA